MPLTAIPTKTEDSLGIVKQDVLPYTDPDTQVPAVQYERLKDAVIANALAIGLADGSTPDSIIERLDALDLQAAYDAGNVIDTTAGPAVVVKTDATQTSLTGAQLDASHELVLKAASSAEGAVDLHATHATGGIRFLIQQQVRLFLRHDGGSQYRIEPGTDLATSLGSTSRRFAEAHVAALHSESLAKHTPNDTLSLVGRITDGNSAAVRVHNTGDFTASAGEQRLVEVFAKNAQSGTASLVAADFVIDGASGAILRARTTVGGEVMNVGEGQVRVAGVSPTGNPGLGFLGDVATGLQLVGVNQLGVVAGKTVRLTVESAQILSALPLRAPNGTAAAPSFAFSGDIDTGLFLQADGQLGLSVAGTARLSVTSTLATSAVPVAAPDGTAAAPALRISSDPDTGIYSAGANQLGVAAAGTQIGYFASSGGTTSHLKLANGNITAGTAPVSNALYTKNIPKAWLKAFGTATIDDDFGVASIASDGGTPAGVTVTFDHSVGGQYQQAIVSSAPGTTATTAKWHTIDNFAVNSCRVRAWAWNGSAVAQVAVAGDWSLVRFGTVA